MPASADTVKFYNGTTGYSGPFNGATTVYGQTELGTTTCPVGFSGCGASDIRRNSEVFNLADGLTITATVNFINSTTNPNQVWNDLDPHFGGLGVGRRNDASDLDQIAGHEVLTLTFTDSTNTHHNVDLTGVATLFASAHEDFGTGFGDPNAVKNKSGIMFMLAVNGGSFSPVSFATANNNGLTNIAGYSFSFEQDLSNFQVCHRDDGRTVCSYKPGPQFYVSALDFLNNNCDFPNVCTHQGGNTPLPAAVWLFGSVLAGGAGVSRWRKVRRARATRAAMPAKGERA